jgi:tRNA/rRNA methyltransferase
MEAHDSIGSGGGAQAPPPGLVRFVLVEPSHCGNIGAAARAIQTMGFRALSVVAPRESGYRESAQAVALAANAAEVLRESRSPAGVVEALEGVGLAFAMTGYAREHGPPHRLVREAALQAAAWLRQGRGPVAFVFGPERSGLTNQHVLLCHASCAIPADPEHGSLNLAQAVQVAAYEMRCALAGPVAEAGRAATGGATVETLERLFAALERALTAIGFHDPARPMHTMARLRSLLARAELTASEADLLLGVCEAVIEPKRRRAGRKHPR